ncbi:acyl-CoA thioesterase [Apibacter muscae]|uniref:Acyl-CoA thioesterase n=1 Tax=Apibacter muscae TaxID=2509004 RepID=A0A563DFM0_9FLAO|nr:acyl-CoA thioesterase [Apibacter muscae]TWP29025.1 acyl-CoA thioesterase [Apibacter muscae]TWP30394.1 acyl-CoA thioesterase [Apibacter muscae]
MLVKEPESIHKIRFMDCDPIGHLSNIRYFDYMLNAREDHCLENYQIDNYEQSKKTGCLWVVLQNQIAYIKEVKFNQQIKITSKIIKFSDKTNTVEILMYDKEKKMIHAVLWLTLIYFNLKTRKSEEQPHNIINLFEDLKVNIPEDSFENRVSAFHNKNKEIQTI